MACYAQRAADHRELGRCLEELPSVRAVDHIVSDLPPSGRPETEVIVGRTPRGTVPNAVAMKVVQSGLGIADVDPANHPDYLRVVVR
jgi:hypothetical protein